MVVIRSLLVLAAMTITVSGEETELLCFGATWCQPYREMQSTFQQLSAEGYPVREIDTDQHAELAVQYRITSVPTLILVDPNGKPLRRIDNASSRPELLKLFRHYRIGPADQRTKRKAIAEDTIQETVATATRRPTGKRFAQRYAALTPVQSTAMASTVRLRVDDEVGHSFGTGTVIDVHGNEALVLTCAHIFMESEKSRRIVIDRFDTDDGTPTCTHGALISQDMDLDIALVSMKLTRPITAASLADLKYHVLKGEPTFSVGCDHGDPPTVMQGHVNDVDKYLGAPNLTASGEPVNGRSGGGLFNQQGRLIGVCNAADPEFHEGLYAALPRVCYELDRNGLSFIYKDRGTERGPTRIAIEVAIKESRDETTPTADTSGRLVWVIDSSNRDRQSHVIQNPSPNLIEYLHRESDKLSPLFDR